MKKLYCDICNTEIKLSENVIENRVRTPHLSRRTAGNIIFEIRVGISPDFDKGELCVNCLCEEIKKVVARGPNEEVKEEAK